MVNITPSAAGINRTSMSELGAPTGKMVVRLL